MVVFRVRESGEWVKVDLLVIVAVVLERFVLFSLVGGEYIVF